MAAADDGLRDQLARWLFRRVMDRDGKRKLQWEHLEPWTQAGWLGWADDLLSAVPGIAEALAAVEKVRRVEALIEPDIDTPHECTPMLAPIEVRRALDGAP